MKKVIYIFALLGLLAFSCSSNDDTTTEDMMETPEEPGTPEEPETPETPEEPEEPETPEEPEAPETSSTILPTRVEIVDADGDTEIITYTYEGMRLIKETSSDGCSLEYSYDTEGRLIGNIDRSSFGVISETFGYDTQGRVNNVRITVPDAVTDYTVSYSNSNNTITSITDGDQEDPEVIMLSNGNFLMLSNGDEFKDTYTYGTNNGVFSNVANREVFVTLDTENIHAFEFSLNNVLTELIEDATFGTDNITYAYTFTASNFPRVVTVNYDGDITTYTYTYNND